MSFETQSRKYFEEIIDTVYDHDWSNWEELEGVDRAEAEELSSGNKQTVHFMLDNADDIGISLKINPDGHIEGNLSKSDYMENMGDLFEVEGELTEYSDFSDDDELYAEFEVDFEEYDGETLEDTITGLKNIGEAYELFQEPER